MTHRRDPPRSRASFARHARLHAAAHACDSRHSQCCAPRACTSTTRVACVRQPTNLPTMTMLRRSLASAWRRRSGHPHNLPLQRAAQVPPSAGEVSCLHTRRTCTACASPACSLALRRCLSACLCRLAPARPRARTRHGLEPPPLARSPSAPVAAVRPFW
jgi:hypothetical protein